MSLMFTNYDRTHMCNHEGMLGRTLSDGTRMCARCGGTVPPEPKAKPFTRPAGQSLTGRRTQTRKVR